MEERVLTTRESIERTRHQPVKWYLGSVLGVAVTVVLMILISMYREKTKSGVVNPLPDGPTPDVLKRYRDLLLIAIPLVALAIERIIELAVTWFEAVKLAFGRSLGVGIQQDAWAELEVRKLREAVDEAERALDPLPPDHAAFPAALAAFQSTAAQLTRAQSNLEASLKNPQYVYLKKTISILAGLVLGILAGMVWRTSLLTALGFPMGNNPRVLDWVLTGMLMGIGSAPVHAILQGLFALSSLGDAVKKPAQRKDAPLPEEADRAADSPSPESEEPFELDRSAALLDIADFPDEVAEVTLASFTGRLDTHTVVGYERTSSDFKAKLNEIAGDLNIEPLYLAAAISFETGGTFSPSIRNRTSGATGLIQFMPATARRMGTTTANLARMTAVEQLDYVKRYFDPYRGRLHTITDVYMTILWPAAVGRGDSYPLFRRGTTAYRQNSGLDTNRDGVVTAGEAAALVRSRIIRRQSVA